MLCADISDDGNVARTIEPQRYGWVCSTHGEDLNTWLVSQRHELTYRRYSLRHVEE